MKVTTIEEAQDISSMQVDELRGSLQNFELVVDNRTEKKGKGIAFTANTADEEAMETLWRMKICQKIWCCLEDSSTGSLNR